MIREQLIEGLQHAASGKSAVAIAVGTVSVPAWIEFVHSDTVRAVVMLTGLMVSFSIIAVNIQVFFRRLKDRRLFLRQQRIKAAILEKQAKENGINPDDLE